MHLENQPPLPSAVRAGRRLGVDVSGHTSRALSHGALTAADLVLGFEPEHVSMSVIEGGSAIERTFMLGELVTLLGHGEQDGLQQPAARARAALELADAQRVRSFPDPRHAVPDPIGMSDREVERVASSIDELIGTLVRGLFGEAGPAYVGGGRW
jgi:protein-tyrosine-phosphatase